MTSKELAELHRLVGEADRGASGPRIRAAARFAATSRCSEDPRWTRVRRELLGGTNGFDRDRHLVVGVPVKNDRRFTGGRQANEGARKLFEVPFNDHAVADLHALSI